MLIYITEKYNTASTSTVPAVPVAEEEDDDHIDVSPSTSTSSASSASSSSSWTSNNSSCDSIATIDNTKTVHYSPRLGVKDLLSPEIYPSSKDMHPPPLPVLKQVTSTAPPPVLPSSAPPTTTSNNKSTANANTSNTAVDPTKKRRRGNLPKEVTEFLKGWLVDHKKHPYPSEKEKIQLANRTGLTVNQINNWFINARRRILQPMLESESLNAQLMAYSEMASLEQKKRRQLDIYAYQGFAGKLSLSSIIIIC